MEGSTMGLVLQITINGFENYSIKKKKRIRKKNFGRPQMSYRLDYVAQHFFFTIAM